jgi:hypothetical protein
MLKKDADVLQTAGEFMDYGNADDFVDHLVRKRQAIEEISSRYLRDP